jgi:hypothetical protein
MATFAEITNHEKTRKYFIINILTPAFEASLQLFIDVNAGGTVLRLFMVNLIYSFNVENQSFRIPFKTKM